MESAKQWPSPSIICRIPPSPSTFRLFNNKTRINMAASDEDESALCLMAVVWREEFYASPVCAVSAISRSRPRPSCIARSKWRVRIARATTLAHCILSRIEVSGSSTRFANQSRRRLFILFLSACDCVRLVMTRINSRLIVSRRIGTRCFIFIFHSNIFFIGLVEKKYSHWTFFL